MNHRASRAGRRRFIALTVTSLAAVPLADTLVIKRAEAAEMLSESDPAAAAVKYKADAAKAPERKSPSEFCSTCTLYTGKPHEPSGACSLFAGKLVAAKGWCTSWESY